MMEYVYHMSLVDRANQTVCAHTTNICILIEYHIDII